VATAKTAPDAPDQRKLAIVREMQARGAVPPSDLTRPEVARILAEATKR
jgi:ATP sulfurylase